MASRCQNCGAVSDIQGNVTGGDDPCRQRSPPENHNFSPRIPTLDTFDNLPNVESSPSKVSSISNLKDKVADATFLGKRIFLDIFLLMVGKDPLGSVPSVKSMQVLKEASRPNRLECQGGLLKQNTRGGFKEKELSYSSLLTAQLSKELTTVAGKDLLCLHQMVDSVGGEIDIAVYMIEKEWTDKSLSVIIPAAIFECAWRGGKYSKHGQAAAYVINVFSQLSDPIRQVILAIELVMHPDNDSEKYWVNVRGYSKNLLVGKQLDDALIWEGELDEAGVNFGKILTCIKRVAEYNLKVSLNNLDLKYVEWKSKVNVGISSDTVYKVFDYRQRPSVQLASRRSHSIYIDLGLAQIVFEGSDIALIKYRLVGSHKAVTVEQVLGVCKFLKKIHSEGICHGDVRLYNSVFILEEPLKSRLIDFDYSGREYMKYPEGYNVDIKDGQRHAGARPGEYLCTEHDWFALAGVLRLFDCVVDTDKWTIIINHFEKGHPNKAIKVMKSILDANLALRESVLEADATGSPLRARPQIASQQTNATRARISDERDELIHVNLERVAESEKLKKKRKAATAAVASNCS